MFVSRGGKDGNVPTRLLFLHCVFTRYSSQLLLPRVLLAIILGDG